MLLIVTPCKSDMASSGLSPLSHLADGRLTLALVRSCTVLEMLSFLWLIPRSGALVRAAWPAPAESCNEAHASLQ